MSGDWKRACTSRTLVESALAGSQALASFFSAPISFPASGKATTSTTAQTPTTTHLVQLPAGISAILLSLLIGFPRVPPAVSTGHQPGPHQDHPSGSSGTRPRTAAMHASVDCSMSLALRTDSGPTVSNRHRHLRTTCAWTRCTKRIGPPAGSPCRPSCPAPQGRPGQLVPGWSAAPRRDLSAHPWRLPAHGEDPHRRHVLAGAGGYEWGKRGHGELPSPHSAERSSQNF